MSEKAETWFEGVEQISPHLVRISTPSGYGTGWMVSLTKAKDLCAIATAAHVIDHANKWEQPVRITHHETGESRLLRSDDRAIKLYAKQDIGLLILEKKGFPLPDNPLHMIERDYHLKPGVPVGWVGFPVIESEKVCFFSGTISTVLEQQNAYLVDGVAIHGISGGPAFTVGDNFELIGVVSQYIANHTTGEALPGLLLLSEVTPFHDITDVFSDLDDARSNESPPKVENTSPSEGNGAA